MIRQRSLLEPGVLFQSALFNDLLRSGDSGLAAGVHIGPYVLVREIGRGGMGEVWLAQRDDGELDQRVAIKCISLHLGERRVELFRRERQMLSELQHPAIARLIDAGHREDGLLWFAMEYVDGDTVDRYMDGANLALEGRLRLFTTIVDAVSFAHGRLVIHRDIKPGNILVNREGHPKLLDFGIATLFGNETAVHACSPGWASPEQRAGLRADAGSDQYQLGLLLDVLLRRDDSTLDRRRPGDPSGDGWIAMPQYRRRELRAIVSCACADDPRARYRSVDELGREIEHLLEHRPVSVLREKRLYVFAAFVRRCTAAIVTFTVVLALIAALVGLFSWRLAKERDVSLAEATRAEVTKNFLIDLFRNADPTRGSDPHLTARQLVQTGVARAAADQSLPKSTQQELLQLLADIQLRLGDRENASALLDKLDLGQLSPGQMDELRGRLALIEGNLDDSEIHFRRAIAINDTPERELFLARAQMDTGRVSDARDRIASVLRNEGNVPDPIAAYGWQTLGSLYWKEGRAEDAIAAYDRGLDRIARSKSPISPSGLLIGKAIILNDLNRPDDALGTFELEQVALERFPNQLHRKLMLLNQGTTFLLERNLDSADRAWSQMLSEGRAQKDAFVQAAALLNLAVVDWNRRDSVHAVEKQLQAMELFHSIADKPDYLAAQLNLPVFLVSLGLSEEGIRKAATLLNDAAQEAEHYPTLPSRAAFTYALALCAADDATCVEHLHDAIGKLNSPANTRLRLECFVVLAHYAFEHRDATAMAEAIAGYSALAGSAPVKGQSDELALFRALQQRSANKIAGFIDSDRYARRAMAFLDIERGDSRSAHVLLVNYPAESSAEYWLLRRRVALASRDANEVKLSTRKLEEMKTFAISQLDATSSSSSKATSDKQ